MNYSELLQLTKGWGNFVSDRINIWRLQLVWHGGMNLLGKVDVWDNLMRISNHQVAAELLEIALGYLSGK